MTARESLHQSVFGPHLRFSSSEQEKPSDYDNEPGEVAEVKSEDDDHGVGTGTEDPGGVKTSPPDQGGADKSEGRNAV